MNIEIARSNSVLRVPNSALRFRPTNEIYAALGQTPPDPATLRDFGGRGGGGRGMPPAAGAPSTGAAPSSAPAAPAAAQPAPQRPRRDEAAAPRGGTGSGATNDGEGTPSGRGPNGGGGRGFGGGRGDLAERMATMTPEQQQRMRERMRARGMDPSAAGQQADAPRGGRGAVPNGARAPRNERPAAQSQANAGGATTIDALFGPPPRTESPGRVWTYANNQLTPVRLRVGSTDGQLSEVIEGDLTDGQELVTNVALASSSTRPAATAFPFGQPGRGGPGGGFGGPGGGGGGNNRGGGNNGGRR